MRRKVILTLFALAGAGAALVLRRLRPSAKDPKVFKADDPFSAELLHEAAYESEELSGDLSTESVLDPAAVTQSDASELEAGHTSTQFVSRSGLKPQNSKAQSQRTMRITKRSSGGRGEYEISESFGAITPRNLLNRAIVLDLGSGLEIVTGVLLLLRHGKRRLRIDEKSGCTMHLHRQLAAALMLPYPARDENGWAADSPVIRSGLYGITNIEFSSVALVGNDTARVAVATITAASRAGEEYVHAPERLIEIIQLWERHTELPPQVASLIAEHKRLVQAGGPLSLNAEKVVSDLQEAATHHRAEAASGFSASQDVLPLLVHFLHLIGLKKDDKTAASEIHSPHNVIPAVVPQAMYGSDRNEGEADIDATTKASIRDEPRISVSVELGTGIESGLEEAQPGFQELNDTDGISAAAEEFKDDRPASEAEEADSIARSPPSPRRYRPQPRGPVVTTRSPVGSQPAREQRDVSVPVDLRLRSRAGGTYVLTFLPRRRVGMPSDLEIIHANQRIQLSALHDNWYLDITLPESGRHLRGGLAWYTEDSDNNFRWSLAGREVFVLGTHPDLGGFVSVPRLVLGAQHVVICSEEILQQVSDILHECCERIPQPFGESDGLPPGWVGIGPLVPTAPLPPSKAGDVLDALRPDPEVRIEFEGGVRIQHNQFLVNYPPRVRVYGSIPDYVQVMIDGRPVENVDDGFTNTGWDSLGGHIVSCGVASRSYTIVEPDDGWENWSAYSFPLNVKQGSGDSATICGALVTAGTSGRPVLMVPASAPVLLGSRPGEIYVAPVRQDLRAAVCPAFPPFAPIWAVPQNPLRVNKTMARVVLLQEHAHTLEAGMVRHFQPSRTVLQWCTAILDCCRKGLDVDPPEDSARKVWMSYRNLARRLWRASR